MLDIKFIKDNRDVVERAQALKKVRTKVNLDELLALYEERKSLSQQKDEINKLKNEAAAARDVEKGTKAKNDMTSIEEKYKEVDKKYVSLMLELPNIPSPDTPEGMDDTENKVIRSWGTKPAFDFEPKEHFDIGSALGIIDNETAGDVTGARFTYLKGGAALLQFALIQRSFRRLHPDCYWRQSR